jgi:quinol monooxygenase YgiN
MRLSKFGQISRLCARWASTRQLLLFAAVFIGGGVTVQAQTQSRKMIAVSFITVDTHAVDKGVSLLKTLADETRKEPGNKEFTVLKQIDRPYRFATVGVWTDAAAFQAHQSSAAVSSFNKSFEAVQTSPPDEHDLQDIVFDLPASVSAETHAPTNAPSQDGAPAKPAPTSAIYMLEHFDFPGVPEMVVTAVPVIEWLAHAGAAQPGDIRYEIYRQTAPKVNHFQIISEWTDRAAFDAYEHSIAPRKFRHITDQNGPAWRVNLYDQRLYEPVN